MHGLVSAPRARVAAMLGGSGLVPSFDLNFARLDNPVTKYGFTFTRATSATYVNASGLIATAASGELRYTYDPVTLSALGVLIEEARTNLSTTSTEIAIGSNVSLTPSQASPDGGTSAVTVTESVTTSGHYSNQIPAISFTSGTTYTMSVFIKPGTTTRIQLSGPGAVFGTAQYANFGLTGSGSVLASSGVTATIQRFGGGWYRCAIAVAATSTTTGNPFFCFIDSDAATRLPSYLGTGLTVTAFGWQIEAGSFPTSYIPTTGTTATRNADVLSLTGAAGRTNLVTDSAAPSTQTITVANATQYTLSQTGSGTITLSGASTTGPLVGAGTLTFTTGSTSLTLTMSGSPANVQLETGASATTYIPTTNGPRTVENVASWFSNDEGTVVCDFNGGPGFGTTSAYMYPWHLGIGSTAAPTIATRKQDHAANPITVLIRANGAAIVETNVKTGVTANTNYKTALAYKLSVPEIVESIGGAAVVSHASPSALLYGITTVRLGANTSSTGYLCGTISRIRYYNRRLPNATLQSLTA